MDPVTEAERLLEQHVLSGKVACATALPLHEKVVRAEFLYRLCISSGVDSHGVTLEGAHVEGELDFSHADMRRPLVLRECTFRSHVSLRHAHLRHLDLTRSVFAHGLNCHGVNIEDDFQAEDIEVHGGLVLDDANVGKSITLDRSRICKGEGENCVDADGIVVGGDLNIADAEMVGCLRIVGAHISGDLMVIGSVVSNEDGDAVYASRIIVDGCVFIKNDFVANGMVVFALGRIGGNFECVNSRFWNGRSRIAFRANGIKVGGNVWLSTMTLPSKFGGEVSFINAEVGLAFNADGAHFISDDVALKLDNAQILSKVSLKSIEAEGIIRLCNMHSHNDVFLENMRIKGARESWSNGLGNLVALRADAMSVRDGLFFYSRYEDKQYRVPEIEGEIRLSYASVGQLNDGKCMWPENYFIDNFTYNAIGGDAEKNIEVRKKWVKQEGGKLFRPQPYDNLANVFRQHGMKNFAKSILILKKEESAKIYGVSLYEKVLNFILKYTIMYGYETKRSLCIIFLVVMLGGVIFSFAYSAGYIVPSVSGVYNNSCYRGNGGDCSLWININNGMMIPREYPSFSPFVYSIETFIPFVKLRQADYWGPVSGCGSIALYVVRIYLWIHIGLGWVLSTIAVSSMTGFVRRGD